MNQLMIKYGIDYNTLSTIFRSRLEEEGIIFDRESDFRLERTAKRIYLRTNHHADATKSKKKTAWYLVDVDKAKINYGWYHGGGASFTYSLYEYIQENNLTPGDVVYTPEQQQEDLKRYLDQCRRAEQSKTFLELVAIVYMGFEWSRSLELPPSTHNYAIKKRIKSSRARLYNPRNFNKSELIEYLKLHHPEHVNYTLLINHILNLQPDLEHQKLRLNKMLVHGINIKRQIVFLQTIAEHKNKKGEDKFSLRGVQVNGSFQFIFKSTWEEWDQKRIILCEGYATAEAIAEAIFESIPIAAAYVAGNLMNVAKEIRTLFPWVKIYIFNDNDVKTALESKINRNPGVYAAHEALKTVSGYMIGPDFESNDIELSDWNDYSGRYGVEQTRSVIRYKMKSAVLINAEQSHMNHNYSIEAIFFGIQCLDAYGVFPDSMTLRVWSSVVLSSYASVTGIGLSQVHPVELVRDSFIGNLIEVCKKPRYVTSSNIEDEIAGVKCFTALVQACARKEAILSIQTKIVDYIKHSTHHGQPVSESQKKVKAILSNFLEPEWVDNYLKNLFS